MFNFFLKKFILLALLSLSSKYFYSAENDENTPPHNASYQPQKKRKQRRQSLKQAAKESKKIDEMFKAITKKNKLLSTTDVIPNDIAFDSRVFNTGTLSSLIITNLDTTTQSSLSETPIAMIIPYEDGYFLAKAIIEKRPIYELFYDSSSAESWIMKIFQNHGMPSPIRRETALDISLQEFDQAKKEILAQRNPFLETKDKNISEFVIDPSQAFQIKEIADGRFLARLQINPEIQHNVFRYFDNSQSAENWITNLSEQRLKKPMLTQKEKKERRSFRLKLLL